MRVQSDIHTFCENLRFLRHKYDLSQEEMAQRLKLDIRILRLIELDILPDAANVGLLYTLSEEFQLPPWAFFTPLW